MQYLELITLLTNDEFIIALQLQQKEYLNIIFADIESLAQNTNDIELSSRLAQLESKIAFYFKDKSEVPSNVRIEYVKGAFYYLTSYLCDKLKYSKEIHLNL